MKYAKIDLGFETRYLAFPDPNQEVATGIQVTKSYGEYSIAKVNAIVSKEQEITKAEFDGEYKNAIAFFKDSLIAIKKHKKWETRLSEINILQRQGKGATAIAKTLGISRDYVYKVIRKNTSQTP